LLSNTHSSVCVCLAVSPGCGVWKSAEKRKSSNEEGFVSLNYKTSKWSMSVAEVLSLLWGIYPLMWQSLCPKMGFKCWIWHIPYTYSRTNRVTKYSEWVINSGIRKNKGLSVSAINNLPRFQNCLYVFVGHSWVFLFLCLIGKWFSQPKSIVFRTGLSN